MRRAEGDSWRRLAKWRRWLLYLWGAWFPFLLLVALASASGLAVPPRVLMWVAAPWAVVVGALSLRVSYWPCPRCGRPFFLRLGIVPTGGEACPHCKLAYGGGP